MRSSGLAYIALPREGGKFGAGKSGRHVGVCAQAATVCHMSAAAILLCVFCLSLASSRSRALFFRGPRSVGFRACRIGTRGQGGARVRAFTREREQPAGVIGFRWRRMRLFGDRRTGCSYCCRTGRFVNCRGALCDAAFGFK